jgi:hypothetical protein
MNPLPFPAADFMANSGVRIAILRGDYQSIAALILIAAASWTQQRDRGTFPDDPERIAATVGMPLDAVVAALEHWEREGWVARGDGLVWIPWVMKAAAVDALTEVPVVARGLPRANGTGKVEADGWPKQYTKWAVDAWNDHFGKGSAPAQEVAGHFAYLRRQGAPFDEVSESWKFYIATTEARYASPGAWRKRWKTFLSDSPNHSQHQLDVVSSVSRQLKRGDFDDDPNLFPADPTPPKQLPPGSAR